MFASVRPRGFRAIVTLARAAPVHPAVFAPLDHGRRTADRVDRTHSLRLTKARLIFQRSRNGRDLGGATEKTAFDPVQTFTAITIGVRLSARTASDSVSWQWQVSIGYRPLVLGMALNVRSSGIRTRDHDLSGPSGIGRRSTADRLICQSHVRRGNYESERAFDRLYLQSLGGPHGLPVLAGKPPDFFAEAGVAGLSVGGSV